MYLEINYEPLGLLVVQEMAETCAQEPGHHLIVSSKARVHPELAPGPYL